MDHVDHTQFKKIVGSLMYLTTIWSNLMFVVSMIRYMEHHVETHSMAAKRIQRYLKGTIELRIQYKKRKHSKLVAYSNNDYENSVQEMETL